MSGCPRCQSERLAAVPVFLMEFAIRPLNGGKHRYRCTSCGWIGRRTRLKRRSSDLPSLNPNRKTSRSAIVFFAIVMLFLTITGVIALRGCSFRRSEAVESDGTHP